MNATYTLRYNRTTNHIGGIEAATMNNEFTMNACGSLTRSSLAQGKTVSDLAEALEIARTAGGRKLCKNCEKAALAAIAALEVAEVAETEEAPETATEAPALAVLIAYSNGTTETVPVTSAEEARTRIHLARQAGHRAIQTAA